MEEAYVGGPFGRWSRIKSWAGARRPAEPVSQEWRLQRATAHERRLQQASEQMRERLLRHPVEGEWQDLAYWDPLPTARDLTDAVGVGRWEDRSWLNVPGPFYAGETDTGQNGPYYLPEHVLSSDEHYEFVHRQPADPREVAGLVEIAHDEPMGGYAWDGDRHWTPQAVRDWWARVPEIRAWIAEELDGDLNDPQALRRYAAYLDDGLEDHLRGYLFWLTEGREPRLGEALPEL